MDLLPLAASFGIVALAELGDKTQLTIICLSANKKAKNVLIGALVAFALVDGISALVGGTVAAFVPARWIGAGAGVAFLIFGLYSLLSKSQVVDVNDSSVGFTRSFTLVGLMELGDKTQLSAAALSAEYVAPLLVFIGVMLAMALMTGIGIALGSAISRFVPMRYVKVGSALVFIIFGVLFLVGAITGTKLM